MVILTKIVVSDTPPTIPNALWIHKNEDGDFIMSFGLNGQWIDVKH